jgi:hypothetical protein
MTTKEELESLKKKIATLEAKIASEEKQEIKTCEDAWNKLKPEWFINTDGSIDGYVVTGNFYNHIFEQNQCNMTSEKEAKRIKALIQLRLIAEAMNEGVKQNGYPWFIDCDLENVYRVIPKGALSKLIPTFNTKELVHQAFKNFKPLFEDLYR